MARLLYILAHSTEAPERTIDGLATARAGQQGGHDVGLWLTGEGVRLGVKGVADTLNEPRPESAAALVTGLLAGGAAFHVERVAFEQRQFSTEMLLEGAALADAGRLADLIADGWHAVSL